MDIIEADPLCGFPLLLIYSKHLAYDFSQAPLKGNNVSVAIHVILPFWLAQL